MKTGTSTLRQHLPTYAGLFLLHVLPVAALIMGPAKIDWIVLACIWPLQAIGATIGLHRYFAHKSFRTSRAFQAFLAFCASLSLGDPIGFTGKHRMHHKYSDQHNDVHSPAQGIWHCWIGSLLDFGHSEEETLRHARDLCEYPELVWLHQHKRLPGLLVVSLLFLVGGFTMVAIGFALGVVSIIHLGGATNYFCHCFGQQRFETKDDSRNNWVIALLTMGEGWHNNHHYYQSSARAGFYWWEIDVLYYIICLFEQLGLIWQVRRPPERVYRAGV